MKPIDRKAAAIFAAMLLPQTAAAQSVQACDWQASARAIVEPWEDNTATFANGAVRLANLDTVEPAVGFGYILVLSPPVDEVGSRQCKTIGGADGIGFAGVNWDMLEAGYDPARGLVFETAVSSYDYEDEVFVSQKLTFTVNQATGDIAASLGPLVP